MLEILPLSISVLILTYLSSVGSKFDRSTGSYIKKDKFFYCIMVIALIIFAGTRSYYNDTWIYRGEFNTTLPLSREFFQEIDWAVGANPGFRIIMAAMHRMHFTSQDFIMAFAIVSIAITYWFFWKYTTDIFFSSFLAFVTIYTDFLAAIKQAFATSLCLIAVDRLLEGKKVRFVLWVLLAVSIHPYAIMYLICPLLMFKPWTRKTWYMIFVFLVVGISFQFLAERIIVITTMMGEEYTAADLTEGGMNPFRVMVRCLPILLTFTLRDRIVFSWDNKKDNLFFNLTMLGGEFSFVALFGTALMIGRISNYFMPFQVLAFPWIVGYFDEKYRETVRKVAILLFLAFFVSECYLSGNDAFDDEFSRISLWEYFGQFLG